MNLVLSRETVEPADAPISMMAVLRRIGIFAVVLLLAAALWLPTPLDAQGDVEAGADTTESDNSTDLQNDPDDTTSTVPTRRYTNPELIGWMAMRRRLGNDMPTGRGIVGGHVEGLDHAYLPDVKDRRLAGVQIIGRSGQASASDHATKTARVIYGPQGMARGAEALHSFSADNWLSVGYLRTGLAVPPAEDDPVRVFNHSWVSSRMNRAEEVLRRIDYQIDERDVIFCVGVDNRRNSAVPKVLASAYNVIAVGTSGGNGASSGGYTLVETPGRCKPDIVGARQLTSFTTAQVTAAAITLLEVADRMDRALQPAEVTMVSDSDAQKTQSQEVDDAVSRRAARSEVIKAVLLTGATKPAFWQPVDGHPLDEHLGAGLLHVDNSLRILGAGPLPPGDVDGAFGWDLREMSPEQSHDYTFEIAEPVEELSVMAVWNRRIAGQTVTDLANARRYWDDTPRLADFKLRLIRADADSESQYPAELELAVSDSLIDNVEHIYVPELPAGRYRLELMRKADGQDEPWDVALAWRAGPSGKVE